MGVILLLFCPKMLQISKSTDDDIQNIPATGFILSNGTRSTRSDHSEQKVSDEKNEPTAHSPSSIAKLALSETLNLDELDQIANLLNRREEEIRKLRLLLEK
jgi:hypothetical protein